MITATRIWHGMHIAEQQIHNPSYEFSLSDTEICQQGACESFSGAVPQLFPKFWKSYWTTLRLSRLSSIYFFTLAVTFWAQKLLPHHRAWRKMKTSVSLHLDKHPHAPPSLFNRLSLRIWIRSIWMHKQDIGLKSSLHCQKFATLGGGVETQIISKREDFFLSVVKNCCQKMNFFFFILSTSDLFSVSRFSTSEFVFL